MDCYQRSKTSYTNGALMNQTEEVALVALSNVDGESPQPAAAQCVIAFLKKSVSSAVMFSYLSLTIGQSYAMDKVAPENFDGIEFGASHSTSVKQKPYGKNTVVPIDLDSPVSVAGLLHQDIGSGIGINSSGRDKSADGFPINGLQGILGSVPEEKENTIKLTQAAFEKGNGKVHPFEIEQTDVDIETGHPKTLADQADEKEDDNKSVHSIDEEDTPESIAKRDAILKDWNDSLNDVFKRDMNHYDWAYLIIPLVLTGVIAKNEILGEFRLWYDSIVGTYGITVPGYEFLYLTPENVSLIKFVEKIVKRNAYISLPPYLLSRISSLCGYVGHSLKRNNLKTKIGFGLKALGLMGVTLAAVNAGAVPALSLYSSDIKFDNTAIYAQTLPPYLFAFYAADSFLINSLFRDELYKYLFVDRKDDDATKLLRNALVKKARTVKAWVASMTDDELVEFDQTMAERSESFSSEYSDIDTFKYLIKMAAQNKDKNRRYSVNTRNKQVESHFNIYTFLKNKWPFLLGLGLAAGGAYLTCNASQHSFESAMQTKISTHLGWPHFDFNNLGTYTYQQFGIARYEAFLDATENVEVFNNGTGGMDWCEQCLNSAKYSTGSLEEGGSFVFTDCPGTGYIDSFTSNPGDLGYTYDQCWGLFDFIKISDAYMAGITVYDDYVAPPLDSLTLSPTAQSIAMTAAVIYAAVNAVLAAPAISEDIARISDSFSSEPEHILPAKRNKVWNALTLTASGVESLVHSTFIATAAWYYLQKTAISESWLWTIVALTWVTVAANFFKGFDDAYSQMLTATAKGFQSGKKVVSGTFEQINSYSFVRDVMQPVYKFSSSVSDYISNVAYVKEIEQNSYVTYAVDKIQSRWIKMQKSLKASIICDDWINRLNKIESITHNASKDVVDVMSRELVS